MSTNYLIRISGHLDREWVSWFPDFEFAYRPDGTTDLHGCVRDQPELHGILNRINQLGLILVKLERIEMEVVDE